MEDEEFHEGGMDAMSRRGARGHVGEILRAARLEEGRELADIAAQTRVPLRHLTALEEGDHATLPAIPYTVGFVKSYARAVHLDPEELSYQFRQETTLVTPEPSEAMVAPIDERRAPPKSAMFIGIALLALVVAGIGLWSVGLFDSTDEAEFDPLAENTEVATEIGTAPPELTETEAAADEPEVATASSTLSGPIVITADEDAWTRIRGSGEVLLMRVMEAGERFEVPTGRSDLEMRTGNAGAITITVGGQTIPKLGGDGDVIGDIQLTPAGLEAAIAARQDDG